VHPGVPILEVSATTGQGMDEWRAWLSKRRQALLARAFAAPA